MAKKTCKNCETEFDAKFCPECGAKDGEKLEGTDPKADARKKLIDEISDAVITKAEERRQKNEKERKERGRNVDPFDGIF